MKKILAGRNQIKSRKKSYEQKRKNTLTEGFPLITVDLLPLFGTLALKILSDDIHFMVMMVILRLF